MNSTKPPTWGTMIWSAQTFAMHCQLSVASATLFSGFRFHFFWSWDLNVFNIAQLTQLSDSGFHLSITGTKQTRHLPRDGTTFYDTTNRHSAVADNISNITIQSMEPVGCWNWCDPLHRTLTVASPKSPIFTVRLSVRKMSIEGARLKNTNQCSSHTH